MQILLRDWLQNNYEINLYACVFIVDIWWNNSTNEELFGERKGDGCSKEETKQWLEYCVYSYL